MLPLLSSFKSFSVPLSFSFILRKMFNHHQRCLSTKIPGSTDQFPSRSTWPLSSTREKEKGTTWLQWEKENNSLTVGLQDTYFDPQGLNIKMFLAGETLNIFLLTWISNINIILSYSNSHNKFASTTFKN